MDDHGHRYRDDLPAAGAALKVLASEDIPLKMWPELSRLPGGSLSDANEKGLKQRDDAIARKAASREQANAGFAA
jgi:hypothetical protein